MLIRTFTPVSRWRRGVSFIKSSRISPRVCALSLGIGFNIGRTRSSGGLSTHAPGPVSLTYRSRRNPLYSQLLLVIGNAARNGPPFSLSLSLTPSSAFTAEPRRTNIYINSFHARETRRSSGGCDPHAPARRIADDYRRIGSSPDDFS